jgi:hypothetical protein
MLMAEGCADLMQVLPVRAQHADLAPGEAGGHH